MNKAAALYQFFSYFGLDAYEENSVYALETPPAFPYLTYEMKTDAFGVYDTALSFSLWYRSTSWAAANAKVDEYAFQDSCISLKILHQNKNLQTKIWGK